MSLFHIVFAKHLIEFAQKLGMHCPYKCLLIVLKHSNHPVYLKSSKKEEANKAAS